MAISSASYGGGNTGSPLDFSPIFQGMAMLGQRREQERIRQVEELNNLVNPLIERWGIQGFAQSGLPFVDDWAKANQVDLSSMARLPWNKDQQFRFDADRRQLLGMQEEPTAQQAPAPTDTPVQDTTPQTPLPREGGEPLMGLRFAKEVAQAPERDYRPVTIFDNFPEEVGFLEPPSPYIMQFVGELADHMRQSPLTRYKAGNPIDQVQKLWIVSVQNPEERERMLAEGQYSPEAARGLRELAQYRPKDSLLPLREGEKLLHVEPLLEYLRQNEGFWSLDAPEGGGPQGYAQQYGLYKGGANTPEAIREQLSKFVGGEEVPPTVTVTSPTGEVLPEASTFFTRFLTETPKPDEEPWTFVDRVLKEEFGMEPPPRGESVETVDMDPENEGAQSARFSFPLLGEDSPAWDWARELGDKLGLEHMSPLDAQMLRQTLIDRVSKGEPIVDDNNNVTWLTDALSPQFIPGLGVVENFAAILPHDLVTDTSPDNPYQKYLNALSFYKKKAGTPAEGAAETRLRSAVRTIATPLREAVQGAEEQYQVDQRRQSWSPVYSGLERVTNDTVDVFAQMAATSPEMAAAVFPETMERYRQGAETRHARANARIAEGQAQAYEGSFTIGRDGEFSYQGSPEYVVRMRELENKLSTQELDAKTIAYWLDNFEDMMLFEKAQAQLQLAHAELVRRQAEGLPTEQALEQMRIQGQVTEAQYKMLTDHGKMLQTALLSFSDVAEEDRQMWVSVNNLWLESMDIPFRMSLDKVRLFREMEGMGFWERLGRRGESVLQFTPVPVTPQSGNSPVDTSSELERIFE